MKFPIIFTLIVLSLILLIVTKRSSRTSTTSNAKLTTKEQALNKAHTTTTGWVRPLIKTASSYHSFANLAYCPGDIINQLACPLCESILDASFKVFKFHKTQKNGHEFTFVILYSKNRHEVVVSFSGPKSSQPEFYSTIYSSGFKPFQKVKIEKDYLSAYKGDFRCELQSSLESYFKKLGAPDEKVVFVGHSFGGSLATLAAFDMVKKGVINACEDMDSPVVYTYGSLRIGDAHFVEETNKLFRVVRVVKANDYATRMPNCTWSPVLRKYKCPTGDMTNYDMEHQHYILNYYGQKGGLQSGIESAYKGDRQTWTSFMEVDKKLTKRGWHYSANNPGYFANGLGDPFDSMGRTNNQGKMSYSQPLGAEVLYSNKFNKSTICQYFYGVPNCEKNLPDEFSLKANKKYFHKDLTNC
jgi:hypothetical protein